MSNTKVALTATRFLIKTNIEQTNCNSFSKYFFDGPKTYKEPHSSPNHITAIDRLKDTAFM